MDKLTIEEKAKAYDEAIKRVENIKTGKCKTTFIFTEGLFEHIFPELAESEDERISKELIAAFQNRVTYNQISKARAKDYIAWLEKQGEKKHTDNIEPKFHKDEWLTENHPNNYARFVQILEIVNVQGKNRYRISRDLHNDEDIIECRFVEDNWHPFNIQDAKDGDILYAKICDEEWLYLYNSLIDDPDFLGLLEKSWINNYCCYRQNDGWFSYEKQEAYPVNEYSIISPATKEQRDTLMKAMADAGYTFDFETKELKKIEEKPTDWEPQTGDTFRKKGTTSPTYHLCNKRENGITFDFVENCEVGISGGEITIFALRQDYELVERPKSIEDVVEEELNKALQTKGEQKPAEWSEEDEKLFKLSLENLTELKDRFGEDYGRVGGCIDWLKSLKEKVQPKNTWKPSKEMLEALYRAIPENVMEISENEMLLDKLYQGLKYGRVLSKK